MNAPKDINPTHLKLATGVTHGLFTALFLAFFMWQFTRTSGPSYFFLVVQCLPLLILVPGFVLKLPRTYIWLCFIMLVYFTKGVMGVFSPLREWIDLLVLSISVLLFITSMFTSRWMQHAAFSNSAHHQ